VKATTTAPNEPKRIRQWTEVAKLVKPKAGGLCRMWTSNLRPWSGSVLAHCSIQPQRSRPMQPLPGHPAVPGRVFLPWTLSVLQSNRPEASKTPLRPDTGRCRFDHRARHASEKRYLQPFAQDRRRHRQQRSARKRHPRPRATKVSGHKLNRSSLCGRQLPTSTQETDSDACSNLRSYAYPQHPVKNQR